MSAIVPGSTTALLTGDQSFDDNLPVETQIERPKIPIYKIEYMASGNEPEGFKAGLITTSEMAQKEKVNFVIMRVEMQKVWMPSYDDMPTEGPKFFCRSNDGLVPTGAGSDPQCGPCVELDEKGLPKKDKYSRRIPLCPKAIWTKNGKDNVAPDCQDQYKILCLDYDDELPFIWNARSTQFGIFNKFIQDIVKKKNEMDSKDASYAGIRGTVRFKCSVSSKPVKRYYEPVLKIESVLPVEEARKFNALYDEIAGLDR